MNEEEIKRELQKIVAEYKAEADQLYRQFEVSFKKHQDRLVAELSKDQKVQ